VVIIYNALPAFPAVTPQNNDNDNNSTKKTEKGTVEYGSDIERRKKDRSQKVKRTMTIKQQQ